MSAKCVENALGWFQKVMARVKLFLVALGFPPTCFQMWQIRYFVRDERRASWFGGCGFTGGLAYTRRKYLEKIPLLEFNQIFSEMFAGLYAHSLNFALSLVEDIVLNGIFMLDTIKAKQTFIFAMTYCSILRSAENCAENVLTTENQIWRKKKTMNFPAAPCGPLLVSSTGDAGWSESMISGPDYWLIPRPQKGCCLLEIAGRWPRRLESAQECVTTHLPKRATPKTDDAKASANKGTSIVCSWFHAAVSLLCRNKLLLFSNQKKHWDSV